MTKAPFSAESARAFLQLPVGFVAPETDVLVQDVRAILLHNLSLHKDAVETGVVVSPIWEDNEGQASLRAAVVPPQVVKRHFEGPGLGALRDATVVEMIGDITAMLIDEPQVAAQVLETTETLWVHPDAPVRGLQMPYKGHFKVLTLTLADFVRKVGAGFGDIEWIASLGLLDSFHDTATDPPAADIKKSSADKFAKMIAEEESWMKELIAKPPEA